MKVILIKGESQYGVLPYFLNDIGEGFTARSWEVMEIDLCAVSVEECVNSLETGKPDLVFSFNIAGELVDGRGRRIFDIAGAPHILQLVDYPLHTLDRLNRTAPSTGLLMVDPSHVQAMKTLYPPNRFAYLGFSPHGGMGEVEPLPDAAEAFAANRDIPVFFAGTFYRPETPPWVTEAVPPALQDIFHEALRRALAVEWLPAQEALDGVLRDAGLDISGRDEDCLQVRRLAGFVHQQVRVERRYRFFQAAARVGLPITVAGSQYEVDAETFPNLQILGPKPVEEVLALMRRSRMVASISANFGRGSHERPFTAMLAGAAAISDYTTYFSNAFTDGEIALFRWQHLDEDLARIAELLRDPAALFEMARAGQAKAAAEHRWSNRVDGIIAAGKAVAKKLNPSSRLLN